MEFAKNPNITHGTIEVPKALCVLQSRGKPKRPIIVRQEFEILVAVYCELQTSVVRRLTKCIEKVMLHCFISRYKQLMISALTHHQ